jgi:hypothetical protein
MSSYKHFLILLFFVCRVQAQQQHMYSAALPVVDTTQFYKILLPPTVTAKVANNLSALRISDKAAEIPYVLFFERHENKKHLFIEYQIIEKIFLKDSLTQIVIKTPGQKISGLLLNIKNAEVHKSIKISGSSSGNQWFVVKDFHTINSIDNAQDVYQVVPVTFPLSDYTFYKIEIDDKNSAPVDVARIGYEQKRTEEGKVTAIQSHWKTAEDAHAKTTTIAIATDENVAIDKISFNITSPDNYLRRASIYQWVKQDTIRMKKWVCDIMLESTGRTSFNLSNVLTNQLEVVILNGDNAPLLFAEIALYQLNTYCIARLEKQVQYQLIFGNSLSAPDYDLKYFQHTIPDAIPIIQVGQIQDHVSLLMSEQKKWFTDKRIIWGFIILIIILLSFVTFKMMKDMNSKV